MTTPITEREDDARLVWETLRTHEPAADAEAALQALDRLLDRLAEAERERDKVREETRRRLNYEDDAWLKDRRSLEAERDALRQQLLTVGELQPEALAQRFHEAYERLAPHYHYETRRESAVPWSEVPEPNRSLMVAAAAEVIRTALSIPDPVTEEEGA